MVNLSEIPKILEKPTFFHFFIEKNRYSTFEQFCKFLHQISRDLKKKIDKNIIKPGPVALAEAICMTRLRAPYENSKQKPQGKIIEEFNLLGFLVSNFRKKTMKVNEVCKNINVLN